MRETIGVRDGKEDKQQRKKGGEEAKTGGTLEKNKRLEKRKGQITRVTTRASRDQFPFGRALRVLG